MRITFVQYGDYRQTVERFAGGGDETYGGQRYSVDFVAQLTERANDVCVICVATDHHEEKKLPNGVRSFGRRLYSGTSEHELVELVARQRPTHLVLRSPIVPLLRWATRQPLRVLPLLATSFPGGGLRVKYQEWRTARALNHRRIEWIGNHNRNSSFALKRIGVDPRKIIPWDWPADVTPRDYAEKQRASRPLRAFYAGRIQETKGIGDVIRAIGLLVKEGMDISLTAAGAGEIAAYTELAVSMGLAERVTFPGLIPHEQVVAEMHRHDLVLVPSQHAYPEGLPLTIYDTYCSRTPLVASDHPMFRGMVIDEKTALVFRGGDSRHMADALKRLATDDALYARLSKDSLSSWEALQIPVKWGDLLQRWLENTVAGGKWLAEHTIATGRYAVAE